MRRRWSFRANGCAVTVLVVFVIEAIAVYVLLRVYG